MYPYFDIDEFSLDRLLRDWLWLCPEHVRLVAVDAFGDLFLQNLQGAILRLDTSGGRIERISESLEGFQKSAHLAEKRKEWFFEDVALVLAERGFRPSYGKCLAYKTPIVFKESTGAATNVYIADLYEYVSFLGCLHNQIKNVADGGQVRIITGPKPEQDG